MSRSRPRCPTCGQRVTGELNPPGRLPVSVTDGRKVEDMRVVSWHDEPDPVGRPDCVGVLIEVAGAPGPLVIRLKSATVVDDLIQALERHRAAIMGAMASKSPSKPKTVPCAFCPHPGCEADRHLVVARLQEQADRGAEVDPAHPVALDRLVLVVDLGDPEHRGAVL